MLTNDSPSRTAVSSTEASGSPLFASVESFAKEERRLLWHRCRLVFVLGLLLSLILIVLGRSVIARAALSQNLERWESALDVVHVASFALALASLYLGTPGVRRLQATAFAVLAVNVLLVAFSMGPDYPPAFAVSLLLFIPAAVIPWKVSYQAALGLIAATAPALAQMGSYAFLPEMKQRWASRGGSSAFWEQLTVMTVTLLILAATAVLVTHTLYNLRRNAQRAKRLGNYIIEKELGKGAMGEVFVAHHARMVRPCAVKVLRASGTLDAQALARFEREVQVSSSLTHPNTITIYDYGRDDDGTFYYAMEYLEGLDLSRLVERFGPVEPARAIYLLTQVCGSLAEAHARKIVHRDLKPANIFVTQRGGLHDFVKVLDFGLARQVRARGDHGLTETGLILGTPSFIAPEAIEGGEIDTRADIYCLGAVAYFLVTGLPPFRSPSAVQILVDHVKTAPRPPSELPDCALPLELEEIVLRCLGKRPADRYQTAEELEDALRAVPLAEPWTRAKARALWQLHLDIPNEASSVVR